MVDRHSRETDGRAHVTGNPVVRRAHSCSHTAYSLLASRLASATLDTLGGHELG